MDNMGTNLKNFTSLGKKIIGAGINYKSIIKLNNLQYPTKPMIFMKPSTSYITEGQVIKIPPGFQINAEVELGVIIGKTCKSVTESKAMECVGGYCVALDMTAMSELNEARAKGLSWTIGKGFDTACPVSRFIPLENIKDPHNVDLWCTVNEKYIQQGNTEDLIFNVPQLISYVSQYMTLEPNDLLLTGTPSGASPVNRGDIIDCGIRDLVKMQFCVE